jgi:hypothetical protein
MAEFLTTAAVTYQVERVILESKKKLVLVSPYIKITKTFLERLRDASGRGVLITIIYGKSELNSIEKKQIDSIPDLKLYFFENLHAKCYFNESEMVITSMNLYEFSERNNREMGIFITKKLDEEIFKEAVSETHSIIKSATLISTTLITKTDSKSSIAKSKTGFCIRCKDDVENSNNNPYCKDCYTSWEFWNNPLFIEKFCHNCASAHKSSKENPYCDPCNSTLIDFPLKKEDLIVIEKLFTTKYEESKINISGNYMYCVNILQFGDIMIREGYEIRFKYSLCSENIFVNKLKSINLDDLNFDYETKLISKHNSPYFNFTPKRVNNLDQLKEDYISLITKINHSVKNVSIKQNQFWM